MATLAERSQALTARFEVTAVLQRLEDQPQMLDCRCRSSTPDAKRGD